MGLPEDESIINLDSASDSRLLLTLHLQPMDLWLVGVGGKLHGKSTRVFSKHSETLRNKEY